MLRGARTAGSSGGCAAAGSRRSRRNKGLSARGPGSRGDGQQPPPGTCGDDGPGAGSASAGGFRLGPAAAAAPGNKPLCWAPRGRLPASSPAGEAGSRGREPAPPPPPPAPPRSRGRAHIAGTPAPGSPARRPLAGAVPRLSPGPPLLPPDFVSPRLHAPLVTVSCGFRAAPEPSS
ncbi:PREDICTED: putative uncharacterized protein encoded by MAPKAPK5-AS1-like [Lipotes vexillifer]|uniref:Uncharacterized protein n=1 Tax=Lipotes vexillifer TaxID=118797 RepID=A0A340WMR6_LIPVE|nr:PREDICTED: putative uncharacterized protein encoded by MAPKAPK5-AS1-like [Lipotes vexillifer]